MTFLLIALTPLFIGGMTFGLLMTNQNIRIKTLYRNKCVRAVISYKDKRVKSFYVVPQNNTISVDGRTYTINTEYVMNSKGIPTYFYTTERAEPIYIYDVKQSEVSPSDLNIAINSRVATEILNAMGGKMSVQTIVLLMGFMNLIVIAVLGFLLWDNLQNLNLYINEVRDILREVTGR